MLGFFLERVLERYCFFQASWMLLLILLMSVSRVHVAERGGEQGCEATMRVEAELFERGYYIEMFLNNDRSPWVFCPAPLTRTIDNHGCPSWGDYPRGGVLTVPQAPSSYTTLTGVFTVTTVLMRSIDAKVVESARCNFTVEVTHRDGKKRVGTFRAVATKATLDYVNSEGAVFSGTGRSSTASCSVSTAILDSTAYFSLRFLTAVSVWLICGCTFGFFVASHRKAVNHTPTLRGGYSPLSPKVRGQLRGKQRTCCQSESCRWRRSCCLAPQ